MVRVRYRVSSGEKYFDVVVRSFLTRDWRLFSFFFFLFRRGRRIKNCKRGVNENGNDMDRLVRLFERME